MSVHERGFDWNFGEQWCNGCPFMTNDRLTGRHWCQAELGDMVMSDRSGPRPCYGRDIDGYEVRGGVTTCRRPGWCPYRKSGQIMVRPTGHVVVPLEDES
jgi:hypothetical protein